MKKVLLIVTFICIFCLLIGCGKEKLDTYTINVYDIDDELIGTKTIEVNSYDNLYEAINDEFNCISELSDYGTYITSINNSIIDSNWSLMVYVNGKSASTSCDKIIPQKDDKIEFRSECFAAIDYGYGKSMDDIDVLIDKTLYHYLKNNFKDALQSIKTYTGSSYWEILMLEIMKENNIDNNLFNITFASDLIKSIEETDINSLTGTNLGKYYIHAKYLNKLSNDFKNHYLEELNKITIFDSYSTPFVLLPYVDYINDDNKTENINNLINDAITLNTEWGPTSDLWKIMSQSSFVDKTDSIDINDYLLDWVEFYEFGGLCDFCTVVLASCALGLNIRDKTKYNTLEYNGKQLDYVEYILERFLDKETLEFKDESALMSLNQIYASLLTFKLLRENNTKINIFGK